MVCGRQVLDAVFLIQECIFLVFVSEIEANDVGCIDSHAKLDVLEFLGDEDDGYFVMPSLVEDFF